MNDGTALLLSWLRFGETKLDDRYVPNAIAALERLKLDHEELRRPAEPEQIVDALMMCASAIQVELPEQDGLFVYIALLQGTPPHILKAAVIEVLRTHSYRTMPLPAEFVNTAAIRYWPDTDKWLSSLIDKQLRLLQARVKVA